MLNLEENLVEEVTVTSLELEIENADTVSLLSNHTEDVEAERQVESENNHGVVSEKKGRPRKGQKRKLMYSRSERKRMRYSNVDHITESGIEVPRKTFRDYRCNCCCWEKVSVEDREMIFQKFYDLGDYTAQTAYLLTMVTESPIKRKRNLLSTTRTNTRIYTLSGVRVCKQIFRQTLQISSDRITNALKKQRSSSLEDKRGQYSGGKFKLPDSTINRIVGHIRSFPTYISHYCRREDGKGPIFFLESLTLHAMYFDCFREKYPKVKCSFSTYKSVFYKYFNIRHKNLKKDTCNTCDAFQVRLMNAKTEKQKSTLQEQHSRHLAAAKGARKVMRDDLKRATEDDSLEVLTFNLEKALPLPRIPTNLVYYKRQIMFYNLGIHSGKLRKCFCYNWVETEGGRGAQEIGSCIRKHLLEQEYCRKVKHLILWSDSCGGQNRNIKITLLLKAVLEECNHLESVTMKFLYSGHSLLPNDEEFSDIESCLQYHPRVYTDEDYRRIIQTCRKKNPFEIIPMRPGDFLGTAEMERIITNCKTDIDHKPINWLKTRQLVFTKEDKFLLHMIEDFSGTVTHTVDLQKRHVDRQHGEISGSFFASRAVKLWMLGKPISAAKHKDVTSMMFLIPYDARNFYARILKVPSTDSFEDDIDGFSCAAVDFLMEEDEIEDMEIQEVPVHYNE